MFQDSKLGEIDAKLCNFVCTQDKAGKCKVARRLGSPEQEAWRDVWGFAEADSESGKEPGQAGGRQRKCQLKNEDKMCHCRPASWMRAWTLWSLRFGSLGSGSSQVPEILHVISQSSANLDQNYPESGAPINILFDMQSHRRRWESREELRGDNEHSKEFLSFLLYPSSNHQYQH